jgi:hypothetical protein
MDEFQQSKPQCPRICYSKGMFCCGNFELSASKEFIIDQPMPKKNEKLKRCTRDDLLIFNDLGINEETLVRIEIRQEKKKVYNPMLPQNFEEVGESNSE